MDPISMTGWKRVLGPGEVDLDSYEKGRKAERSRIVQLIRSVDADRRRAQLADPWAKSMTLGELVDRIEAQ